MVCREATATGLLCFVLLYLAYMVPIGFDLGLFFVSTRVTLVKGFEIANTIKDLTYKQVFSLEGFLLKPEYTGLIEEHHGTRGGGRFITRDSAFPIVPESWNKEEPIYIFGAYDKGDEQDIQRERHGKTAEEYFNDKFAKSKDVMRVSVSDESNFRRVVNQTCSQYGLKKAPTCLIVKLVNNAEARIKKKKYIMMIIIAVLWMLIFGMFALNMKSGA